MGRRHDANARLRPMHRATAWLTTKNVMQKAGIDGVRACLRGLRHAFGVGTLAAGVPVNLTQRWLGHAQIGTTAIYGDVSGAEEREFAVHFWTISPSIGSTI